ncbi:hypothetical protein CLV51_105195 [Chitinophaga niastensis]|uniref:Prokaryotic RING finger family 4 n=1 Tax=Chitinophaga niastensis TaxID=536980 RepID=A0A2P8HF46_CHINA|nr:hypothetical protein [Chitinophaga niastensis]PSL44823.1 hypothetical protein CLV51_105195 [Chitinophaga niastensis]
MNTFLQIGLRQQAIFIPDALLNTDKQYVTPTTALLVANLAKLGFGISEPLLFALQHTSPAYQATILETFREVMGVNKNWTPLVKNWLIPTNENIADHIITYFTNIFGGAGTTLPCGHIIPPNTFPLERYNGCPFCGTPFVAGEIENFKQGSEIRVLELWTAGDATTCLNDLLVSKTALDATQIDSLKALLTALPLPAVKIGMKETLMTVIDTLISKDEAQQAATLFTTPTDILRYLWYKHTGFLQIIEPKTILKRQAKNNQHIGIAAKTKVQHAAALKLKYSRKDGLMVASWLHSLPMDTTSMCEIMHPKRNMWVRFIRALRLPEFSQRKGFSQLRTLMDKFYQQDYTVWQGHVNHFRLRYDINSTMELLKQRPGLFARSLFANILWFGAAPVTAAFAEIVDKVPARLLLTLQMYATYYFDKTTTRAVKPLGGVGKTVPGNKLLAMYDDQQLQDMQQAVTDLCILAMKKRFAAVKTTAKTIYIAPALYKIPLPIGDRSEQIQDLPAALIGTRYAIKGDKICLFMEWGKGLPEQHLDMDLSCYIAYDSKTDICSFSRLQTTGCLHSGDIRSIPNMIGTAEYIHIDIPALAAAGARYVTFTCNAYSEGAITPNLVLGWMDSKHPMKVSEKTGVTYDPSCVQHMVRITRGLAKGLVFGVLEVATREIIWLEMAFDGQIIQQLDLKNVTSILKKLDSKLSIGELLYAKATAQQLEIVDNLQADEVYTMQWALNTAAVTQLLTD